MSPYEETFATWNKVAALYQDKFMDLSLYNESYTFVCQAIKKQNAHLLEIGCGPGNITRYLLQTRPDFQIHATDIAPSMVALARQNNPSATFAVLDCRDISTLPHRYDGIICGFCLPYLSPVDGEKLIKDAANLLNDNGLLYLSFVAGDPATSGFQTSSSGDRCYFYFYEKSKIIDIMNNNLFTKIAEFDVLYERSPQEQEIHTIVVVQKKVHLISY